MRHEATEGDGLHTRTRFILRKGHLNLNSWNGPFWDPNSPSISQEISLILWNLKDHCRVHNSPQTVTYLTQRNQSTPTYPTSIGPIWILFPTYD